MEKQKKRATNRKIRVLVHSTGEDGYWGAIGGWKGTQRETDKIRAEDTDADTDTDTDAGAKSHSCWICAMRNCFSSVNCSSGLGVSVLSRPDAQSTGAEKEKS
jgi:hypothetical protein